MNEFELNGEPSEGESTNSESDGYGTYDGLDDKNTYKSGENLKKRNYEKYLDGEIWQPNSQQQYQPNQQYQQQYEQYRPDGGYVPSNDNSKRLNEPQQPKDLQGLEEPTSIGEWVATILVLLVPCVNIIFLFLWGFGGNVKKSKSNFCKAQLIISCIVGAAIVVIYLIFIGIYTLRI